MVFRDRIGKGFRELIPHEIGSQMPYKDPETKRAYHREYMQRRRAAVKPNDAPVLNPAQEGPGTPRCLDRNRPYTVENRYPWPAYLVQDGYWFNLDTGELVGKAKAH